MILSWPWLDIWVGPMRWLILGIVTGINSATMTCHLRPAKHAMSVSLAFELIKKRSSMPKYISKWKRWKVIDMETHFYSLSILENHSKWYSFHWVTPNFILLLYLTQVLKATLKIHIIAWNNVEYMNNSIGWHYISKFIQSKNMYIFNIC